LNVQFEILINKSLSGIHLVMQTLAPQLTEPEERANSSRSGRNHRVPSNASKRESSFVRSRPTTSSRNKSSVHTQTGESSELTSRHKPRSRDPTAGTRKTKEEQNKELKANYVTTFSRENQLKLNEAFLVLAQSEESPKVEKSDLKKVFSLLGLHFNEEIVSKFCEVDQEDGDLKMSYYNFEKCVLQTMKSQPVFPKDIIKFYKKIDKLKKGQITFETLRDWCYDRDLVLPEDELRLMIRMADTNKDSVISEEEFLRLMASTVPVSGQPRSKNK